MAESVVVDANIVVSALISSRQKIRRELAGATGLFVAPKFVIVELFKHSPKIQQASKLSAEEVLESLFIIINQIRFYEESLISVGSWMEAFRLCRGVDEKDTPYVALSLELNAPL